MTEWETEGVTERELEQASASQDELASKCPSECHSESRRANEREPEQASESQG